ncbi:MAG: flagellar brake domain-containing protein [Litorilituus sp.]|jgi:c-di-GMP-binding flagellar brake protein YcgR|nr:flagellar brake domain-containing protein [Litorilituus sp.]
MAINPTNTNTVAQLNKNLALLHAGSAITIDIVTPAGQKGKFRTTFIGYLPKQYVLVQYPDANKLGAFSQHIKQGVKVTLRGLIEGHEGAVVAFISTLKQTIQMPSRLMVLEFPLEVSLQYLRSSIRIDTNIGAKVLIDKIYWQTTITNLSVSGCQLNIISGKKLVLSEKKNLDIVVEDKKNATNTKLNGDVCNLKYQNNSLSFGVKFSAQSDPQVYQLLLETLTYEANEN